MMYLEYRHKIDKSVARQRIDEYMGKLDNLQFSGGFTVADFKKSWTGDEMQASFNLRKMVIDRRIRAFIRLKEQLVIIDAELPAIVNNFITDENLKKIITRNLEVILES